MSENKAFKKASIANLITRNYNLSLSLFDIEGLLDNELSMSENWFNTFKPRVLILCNDISIKGKSKGFVFRYNKEDLF